MTDMNRVGGMDVRHMARAIIEAVDDKERDDEDREDTDDLALAGPPDDIDKVVKDDPLGDPEFAPDANMMIKDQEVDAPLEPGVAVDVEGDPRVETLADAAHSAWSGWMEYLFGKSQDNEDGSITIPADQVERWRRQMATPYAELSDEEKESDREEARKYIAVIDGSDGEPPVEPAVEPPEGKGELYHSLDPHDGADEGGGW